MFLEIVKTKMIIHWRYSSDFKILNETIKLGRF